MGKGDGGWEEETWVGLLLPGPALWCKEATLEAGVRISIDCKGLTPTEGPKWMLQEKPLITR